MNIDKLCRGCMKEKKELDSACEYCGFDSINYQPNNHWLPLNTILNGKYLVGKVLGEGGFGITYIAIDLNLNMPVAIKEYYPNGFVSRDTTMLNNNVTKYQGEKLEFFEKGIDRFLTEARSIAQFYQTSGIAKVIDFFKENDTAYIVMEYVDGITLKQYLKDKGGKLDIDTVLALIKPVITSLEEVHKAGLIHRDISPDNIMINSKGDLKLLDFGAARKYEDSENKSLSIMLKPGYAPEEQYRTRGVQGPFTDVYALCATMYKMITGKTPPESLERRAEDTIAWPSSLGIVIPENIESTLKKGMEILSKDRIQDMSELAGCLYYGKEVKKSDITPVSASVEKNELPKFENKVEVRPVENKKNYRLIFAGGLAVAAVVVIFVIIKFVGKNDNTDFGHTEAEKPGIVSVAGGSEHKAESSKIAEQSSTDISHEDKIKKQEEDKKKKEYKDKVPELKTLVQTLSNTGNKFVTEADIKEYKNKISELETFIENADFSQADTVIADIKGKINFYENLPDDYSIKEVDTDLKRFPNVTTTVVVGGGNYELSEDNFIVTTSRKNGKVAKSKDVIVESLGDNKYNVTYTIKSPKDLESACNANILVTDGENGGSITGISFSMRNLVEKMYNDFVIASYNCQFNDQYALINSGVILTTNKAFNAKNKSGGYAYIAGQSQATIDAGNLGSNASSDSYNVDNIKLLEFNKNGKNYSILGYNIKTITQYRTFEKLKPEAQELILDRGYELYSDTDCWQTREVSGFETLGLEKDEDGVWKFSTALYEVNSNKYPNMSINRVIDADIE